MSARAADPYGDTDVIDSRAPRFNQGPPRVANMVGIAVLGAAVVADAAGWAAVGAALGLLVAALALVAATTGFCTGCEAYKLGCRLSGRPFVSCPIPPTPAR